MEATEQDPCWEQLDDATLFTATREDANLFIIGVNKQSNDTSHTSCFHTNPSTSFRKKPFSLTPTFTIVRRLRGSNPEDHFSFVVLLDIALRNTITLTAKGLTVLKQYLQITWIFPYNVNDKIAKQERKWRQPGKGTPKCHFDFPSRSQTSLPYHCQDAYNVHPPM